MKKTTLFAFACLIALTSAQCIVVYDGVSAGPSDFQVMWVMDFPREVYFIGESVTFTVTAFASTDPTVLIPDQMAKVTIRNQSLVEVYSVVIVTNANGSAPVTWESPLDSEAGNYTVILDNFAGDKVVKNFQMLFNEETYWQTRVDLIERDLATQYEHLNFLYSYNKFLQHKVQWLDAQFKILWGMTFLTLLAGLYVVMHEMASTKRTSTGLMAYPSKLFEIFIRKDPVELEHEVISDIRIPEAKRPPVYGHTNFCPICDPDKKHPMTENQLKDHLWAVHDRLHMRKDSILAKLRQRQKESRLKAKAKDSEPAKPAFASVEKYREEWSEEKTVKAFRARLEEIKALRKKGQLTDEQYKQMKADLSLDIDKFNEKRLENLKKPVPQARIVQSPTNPTSQNAKSPRKVRVEHINSQTEFSVPLKTSAPKTAIDDLFDKLNKQNNEKVH